MAGGHFCTVSYLTNFWCLNTKHLNWLEKVWCEYWKPVYLTCKLHLKLKEYLSSEQKLVQICIKNRRLSSSTFCSASPRPTTWTCPRTLSEAPRGCSAWHIGHSRAELGPRHGSESRNNPSTKSIRRTARRNYSPSPDIRPEKNIETFR